MALHHDRCPLCGGESGARFLPVDAVGRTWRIDRCASCSLGFLNPSLLGNELDPYYSDDYYGPGRQRFSSGIEGFIPLFRRARARRIMHLLPPGGSALDVGCGRGLMLTELAKKGYRCVGTERSDLSADAARLTGVQVLAGNVETVELDAASFDLITFWQSLEHLENPMAAVKAAARALKPGGRMLIQVPNLDGLQAYSTGDYWFHLDPPRHLWHFNLRSLDKLAGMAGLRRENEHFLSIEYGPFGMLQSWMNAAGIQRDLLFDLLMSRDRATLLPSAISRVALWLGAGIFGPLAFATELAASAMHSGSVIEAIYRNC